MKPKGILQLPVLSVSASLLLPICLITVMAACNDGCSSPKNKNHAVELPANGTLSEEEKSRLHDSCRTWFTRTLEKTTFTGGIIVAKEGNIIYENYRGEIRPGTPEIFNANTAVHIASVSKTFTAMAILQLWQKKKLDIDEPVANYIEDFPYPEVTIRNLLTHRSGLPNYTSFMDATDWDKTVFLRNSDLPKVLTTYKDRLPPAGQPGKHFSYCNTNYALLALVIEKAGEMSYGEYLSESFFRPLGMQNSFVRSENNSKDILLSYDWRGQLIPDNYLDLVYGDKNIYSTPRDLLIWEKALRSGLLFTPETLEQAYAPYSNEKPGVRNYGLGWRMLLYPDGNKIIYHNGWWHGNNASFIRIPQQNAVIIVLGNRYTKSVYKSRELISLFYNNDVPEEDE